MIDAPYETDETPPRASRPSRPAEFAGAFALGLALTMAMAWPVVLGPAEMVFGREIVGRHHDPFTVMMQMAGSGPALPYVQPATDWLGWLLARVLDPVVAYNVLVLSTFPLALAAAYALARYLFASRLAALVAGAAFAFAPLHLAHAAYHPHVAQTHWLPLYLLALVAAIDRPTRPRAVWLALACGGLVLSNFYAGLIGAVITPFVLPVYWWVSPRAARGARNLLAPAAVLGALAIAGAAAVRTVAPEVFAQPAFATQASDVARYSARWWAYLVPPVEHVAFGEWASAVFGRAGESIALVEQQVYVSYAVVVLAAIASAAAVARWRSEPQWRPVLLVIPLALAAVALSLGPGRAPCAPGSWIPACLFHDVAPMFRAYARFAFVTHLSLAIAAGAGVVLLARRSRAGAVVAAGLLLVAGFEYWPMPARARDVLPTMAHRWLMGQPADQLTLDCMPPRTRDAQVSWLMRRPIRFLGQDVPDCTAPDLAPILSALGYTHILIRQPRNWPDDMGAGFAVAADFPDSRVYAVTAAAPPVLTIRVDGFFDREREAEAAWRWMGPEGRWTVRNTTTTARRVRLDAWLESAGWPRDVDVTIDGAPAGRVHVAAELQPVSVGPWTLTPGDHVVGFAARGRPFQPSAAAGSPDSRRLTIAFHGATWVEVPDE
jgi:hypothetical protein